MASILDSYSESYYNGNTGMYTNSSICEGQTFTVSDSAHLDSAKFYIRRWNSPTGNLYVLIYNITGEYGVSGIPTGSPLATSDPVDVSTIDTSQELVEFSFSGDQKILLNSGQYALCLFFDSTFSNNSNLIWFGYDSTDPTHGGNRFYSGNGSTFYSASGDSIFYVYGTYVPASEYSYRLLETGDKRLLETGGNLLLEFSKSELTGKRLLETGDYRLLETGDYRLLEDYESGAPFLIGFGVSGKLGRPEFSDPLNVYGIYQMRMTKKGKVPIKMKFYTPANPQTEAQQANRQKFANAMTAWGNLTDEQKAVYNERAKKRQMFGWGLFIREYYQSN